MRSEHFDLIVIGSGPGGASLAQKVASTGKRILLLERGDPDPGAASDQWDLDRSSRDGRVGRVFHIELAQHDVIFAEGAAAETFVDDDNRLMFHNAMEYGALYPEAGARMPAVFCAPRVEDGLALEVLRRELMVRARRLASGSEAEAAFRGHLDIVTRERITGWAFDPAAPDRAIAIMVLANGVEIGRAIADRYRPDLARTGIGDGQHAFEFTVPEGLAPSGLLQIEVGFAANWSPLADSPRLLGPEETQIAA